MERRSRMLHDEYKKKSSTAKEGWFVGFVEFVVQCV
jgi:hypothetical protein